MANLVGNATKSTYCWMEWRRSTGRLSKMLRSYVYPILNTQKANR